MCVRACETVALAVAKFNDLNQMAESKELKFTIIDNHAGVTTNNKKDRQNENWLTRK